MTTIIPGPKRDLVGYEGNPPKVSWPDGARIAISLVVNYEEGSELAIGDGDATREPSGPADWPLSKRDLAGEAHFEYGSRCGYWRLMDIFDEQEVKCTFYACAVALERNRDAAQGDAPARPRRHVARLALGGRLAAQPRGGARPYPPRHRVRSPRPPASGRSAGTAAMDPASIPASWSSRRAASSTTATPTTTTCRTGRWSGRRSTWSFPIRWPPTTASSTGAPSARRPISRSTSRRTSTGSTRKGQTHPKMMSIGLHMRLVGHPGRAQALAQLHRLRQEPSRRLVRPPHRYRAPLDGAPRLIREIPHVEDAVHPFPVPSRDVVGYNGKPPKVTWPGGARIAISLVVNYEEGSELAVGDGDANPERVLSEIGGAAVAGGQARSRHGDDVRVRRARRLLAADGHLRRATTSRAPSMSAPSRSSATARPPRAIRERGHDVVCHGYRWEDVTPAQPRAGARAHPAGREVDRRDDRRAAARLVLPLWTQRQHARAGGRGRRLRLRLRRLQRRPALLDDGRRQEAPRHPVLAGEQRLRASAPAHFGPPEDFEEHLRYTFDRLYKEGATHPKMMSIGLHMRLVGHPARSEAVSKFIAYAKSFPDVWFAKRIDIARHWKENHA